MKLYRIAKPQYSEHLNGDGSRLYGGRWNPKGVALCYYAATEALAMLETRVHVPAAGLLVKWTKIVIDVPDDLVQAYDATSLPSGWNGPTALPATQEVGRDWIASGSSLALRVPSVISDSDFNVMLNPAHADAGKVVLLEKRSFSFDKRLAQ